MPHYSTKTLDGSSFIEVAHSPRHSTMDREMVYPLLGRETSCPRGLGTGNAVTRDVSGPYQQWIRKIGNAKIPDD